jgi:hypothetical protein
MRLPRFSIRQLMASVVVVALLIPFPFWVIEHTIIVFSYWYLIPIIFILSVSSPKRSRLTLVVSVLFGELACWLLCWDGWSGMWHHGRLPSWLILAVTPIHLVGPVYIADQYWQKRKIGSGEILWALSGMAWMDLMTTPMRDAYPALDPMIGFSRIILAFILGRMIVGKRTPEVRHTWTYYLGWGLVEYDAIVWGWSAAHWFPPWLRW